MREIYPQESMHEFLQRLANITVKSHSHKSHNELNAGKTIAFMILTNLITLPFGRASFGVARSQSSSELLAKFESALYSEFTFGVFVKNSVKEECDRKRALFIRHLGSLDGNQKLHILTLALKDKRASFSSKVDLRFGIQRGRLDFVPKN